MRKSAFAQSADIQSPVPARFFADRFRNKEKIVKGREENGRKIDEQDDPSLARRSRWNSRYIRSGVWV